MLKRLLPWMMLTTGSVAMIAPNFSTDDVTGRPSVAMTLANAQPVSPNVHLVQRLAQSSPQAEQDSLSEDDLFYTFYNQQIQLVERTDQIAVEFQPDDTRVLDRMAIPNYLRLQQDLNHDPHHQSRRLERTQAEQPVVTVKPLGDRYALVELSPDTPLDEQWLQRLQQSYVQSTLPVLSRVQANGANVNSDDESGAIAAADSASIVVTPEIVVSVEPSLTEGATRQLLSQYDMDIVRPLQFSEGRYLVRSRSLKGTAILAAANHLGTVPGIQSATPNFVQSVSYTVTSPSIASPAPPTSPAPSHAPAISDAPSLLPLQWHLNSRRVRPRPYYPTGVQATEAWNHSRGKDVVVAVIDSLIQWDHPDLVDQVYAVPADTEGRLPGEVYGWDFSHTEVVCDSQNSCAVGDGDTRISDDEVAQLRPHLQNTFTLSDDELIDQYGPLARWIRFERPDFSLSQQADWVRRLIQSNISSEFHGTWSAGVVAANPGDRPGAFGVAPAAKFLPVRVFGLGGHITAASLIEAVGYAAARDVDVINLSLGGLLPDQELSGQMFEVMDANPDLVIVAAAGNSQLDGVSFPAALPGVISVGATSLSGNRTFYSSYGAGLDVVAPGGETHHRLSGGILTTSGTWVDGFWQGIDQPNRTWNHTVDPLGHYVRVQGTSFSAPAVSGVLALMKGTAHQTANGSASGSSDDALLDRDRLTDILLGTASYRGLELTQADQHWYRLQSEVGFGTAMDFPFVRPSGVTGPIEAIAPETYFFGRGLVNAAAAVQEVQAQISASR